MWASAHLRMASFSYSALSTIPWLTAFPSPPLRRSFSVQASWNGGWACDSLPTLSTPPQCNFVFTCSSISCVPRDNFGRASAGFHCNRCWNHSWAQSGSRNRMYLQRPPTPPQSCIVGFGLICRYPGVVAAAREISIWWPTKYIATMQFVRCALSVGPLCGPRRNAQCNVSGTKLRIVVCGHTHTAFHYQHQSPWRQLKQPV